VISALPTRYRARHQKVLGRNLTVRSRSFKPATLSRYLPRFAAFTPLMFIGKLPSSCRLVSSICDVTQNEIRRQKSARFVYRAPRCCVFVNMLVSFLKRRDILIALLFHLSLSLSLFLLGKLSVKKAKNLSSRGERSE